MRKLLEKHRASGDALPLIGGHRGCVCQYPENTIQAMEEGLRQGASYLEIDIQLTRDGIPVVYHDTDVSTKTGLPGYVHQYNYSELKEHWPLETFEDVMKWGKSGDVCFALELKSEPAFTHEANLALLGPMVEIVQGLGMFDNVEAFGIDYRVLKELKRIKPCFDIGLIVPAVHYDPVALMREYDAMIYLAYSFMIDKETSEALMNAGYYVSGAILRDEAYIRHACNCHLDMFEHDEPKKAKELISSFHLSDG